MKLFKKTKTIIASLIIGALALGVIPLGGCEVDLENAKAEVNALSQTASAIDSELQQLSAQRADIDKAIADARALGMEQAKLAKLEEMLATVNQTFDQASARSMEINGKLQSLNEQIQKAETQGEFWQAVVEGGSNVLAAASGPYAPLVSLAGMFVGGVVGRIMGRKSGVAAVARPIENARMEEEEKKLNALAIANGTENKFIVFDATIANNGHAAFGVDSLIESATSK